MISVKIPQETATCQYELGLSATESVTISPNAGNNHTLVCGMTNRGDSFTFPSGPVLSAGSWVYSAGATLDIVLLNTAYDLTFIDTSSYKMLGPGLYKFQFDGTGWFLTESPAGGYVKLTWPVNANISIAANARIDGYTESFFELIPQNTKKFTNGFGVVLQGSPADIYRAMSNRIGSKLTIVFYPERFDSGSNYTWSIFGVFTIDDTFLATLTPGKPFYVTVIIAGYDTVQLYNVWQAP